MKKIKVGIVGGYRGTSMINYCKRADNAEVVAICDNNPAVLEAQKEFAEGLNITFYGNFDEFLGHDMDAVVLANYAHQHAPMAIKAMKKGLHVFSEVLPAQTMKEAVELIETVEETGMVYAYGENYCYMPAPYEMKKLYERGELGELEYAEAEYLHNTDSIWPSITYGEKDHWRNNMYSTFYCTHSLGPIIHATKLRPVSVVGFEGLKNERRLAGGARCGSFGLEMVTLENNALVKSIHGALYKGSLFYSMYGNKGRAECAREDSMDGHIEKIYLRNDEYPRGYETEQFKSYLVDYDREKAEGFGHGGSDFFSMYHFIEKIKGNPDADTIDVYEAMDMFLPGMFAHRSILDGNVPKEIPNLRDKAVRDAWRNDTACTDPEVAGDMLLPTMGGGTPEIDDAVYEHVKQLWNEEQNKKDGNYRALAFSQGSKNFNGKV